MRENEPSCWKWKMSSVVVFSDLQTPRGPCSNPRGSRFFSNLLWNVRHTCFQCGSVSLPGPDRARMLDPSETWPIHVHLRDPGYTCKPRRPAALHSYTCLPATQTRPVSQQRGNRSGSTPNHADHRDKELIGAPFFMMI